MSVLDLARPEIRALTPYEAAVQVDDTVRLNANESPWRNGGEAFRRPLNRYPEVRPARLRAQLAELFGCAPGQLLVTRGSSEAIDLLIRSFCRAGRDNIVTTAPTFSMYNHYATVQGAEHRQLLTSPEQDFRVDIDALLELCSDETRLIFACSPNNPTGTLIPAETIVELLERRANRSVVIVDEAYIEFAGTESLVTLLDRYPNLVVLRTLSKALAFAGARCGTAIASVEVIRMLDAVQAPYAIATPVIECVEDALRDEGLAEAETGVAEIVSERGRLAKALSECPFVEYAWPSHANFLLVRLTDAEALVEHTLADGILLRYFGGGKTGGNLDDCARITVGSQAENDRLIATLASFRGGKS